MEQPKPPPRRRRPKRREIDYLLCKDCGTPCYVFEMDGGVIAEAQCLVCSNENPTGFGLGEEAESDDDD